MSVAGYSLNTADAGPAHAPMRPTARSVCAVSRVRISKEALSISVVVRRAGTGTTPFRWEVHRADTLEAVYLSPERFVSMEAAYTAGKARLAEFIPTRSMPPGVTELRDWQSQQMGADAFDEASQQDYAGGLS